MTSIEGKERECWVLSARAGLGLGCTSMETIGGFGRRAGDNVVVSVQWCGRGARAHAVPTGRRTGSVDVQGFRVTTGRIRWLSMLGKGGALLGLQCRAGWRAVREEKVRARFRTAMPLSVSRPCTNEGQSAGWRAANGRRGRQPTIGHRRRWLGGSGGVVAGAGLPSAPWSARACAGWPRASGEESGEVGEVSVLQVGSWCSPGRLLDAGWGLEGAGVRERGRV
jgi:hypothetical protein